MLYAGSPMAVILNSKGVSHARSLASSGKVDSGAWSFSGEDGNKILGDPPNWGEYSRWFFGHNSDADPQTKAAWEYPFGKGGKVYLAALRAIASRASAQGLSGISTAASDLLKEIEKPKSADVVQRAYSLLTIKSIDQEQRIISGIATSASTDRMGDVVDPSGAEFSLPIPLLYQHDSKQPIGQVFKATKTANWIEITAQIAKTDTPGLLKDRLDLAWQSIAMGLVRGLSIGFKSLEESYNPDTNGFHFLKWLWLELSAVTIPANMDATILTVRQFDSTPAASGTGSAVVIPSAGVSASSRVVKTRTERPMKKSYADLISDCVAARKEKTDKIDAMLMKAGEAGITLDESETQQHDDLAQDVDKLDKQLAMYRAAEEREKAAAKPIAGRTSEEGARGRTSVITVERKLPPGIAFARYAMCVGAARGSQSDAIALAKAHYPDDPGIVALIQKTAVGAAATVTSHWADDLVPYNVLNDFIEYLRPGSILGKFGGPNPGGGGNYPNLNRVPFNVRVSGASAGLTGNWVGEGLPALLSKMTTFNTTLTWAKVEALAVLTKEEVRFSNPSAESKVRDDIGRAVNARIDTDFVDPDKAAVANVSPASITNGVTGEAPTGTTAAFFRTDLAKLISNFSTNFLDPSDIVLIMSATMALELSMMVNTLGNNDFPDITMKGGMIRGFPVIVSEFLSALDSPKNSIIVAVKASDVYLADDGVVTIDASDQASLEMSDSSVQSGVSGTGSAANIVSLWQSGLLGLKASREITWKMRRATAVAYITGAAYKA